MPDIADPVVPAAEATGRIRVIAAGRRFGIGNLLAVLFLLLLAGFVIAPELFTAHDPIVGNPSAALSPPGGAHWLGTDYLGRDLWSRIVHGTGRTLSGSLIAVIIGLIAGSALGLASAYAGGILDSAVSRAVDVLLSIPGLLLSMVIVAALGFGRLNAAVAVGIASVAVFTRLMRAEVLGVRNLPFVESARHLGASRSRILLHHVLPNSYSAVLSLTALQFGASILWIASLSFLGFGAPPPEPEWGLLVSEGREFIVSSPWLVFAPAVVIVLAVLSISQLAHLVRDRLTR
ncbi:ABC transporter permease [Mycobacterium sp. C31M]